jgi:ribose transport system substrate-binding protein
VLRALQQSGRKMVPVAIGGESGALCYWRHHPDYVTTALQSWPPADEMELTWDIMMRTLEGQGPKLRSVLADPVKLTFDDVKKAMGEDCSEASTGWFTVGIDRWGSKDYLDKYFLHPADPEAFKPSNG